MSWLFCQREDVYDVILLRYVYLFVLDRGGIYRGPFSIRSSTPKTIQSRYCKNHSRKFVYTSYDSCGIASGLLVSPSASPSSISITSICLLALGRTGHLAHLVIQIDSFQFFGCLPSDDTPPDMIRLILLTPHGAKLVNSVKIPLTEFRPISTAISFTIDAVCLLLPRRNMHSI